MNKHTHLNLDARILIETLLNQQHSFKSIARHLGKDCTTISKEVKSHICFEKSGISTDDGSAVYRIRFGCARIYSG